VSCGECVDSTLVQSDGLDKPIKHTTTLISQLCSDLVVNPAGPDSRVLIRESGTILPP